VLKGKEADKMYHCRVTNYGQGRNTFPTRIGNLFIGRRIPYDICDDESLKTHGLVHGDARGIVEDLRVFEKLDKLGFETVVDDENGHPSKEPVIDYAIGHSINELRSIAAGRGVKGAFFMSKAQLIQILKED